MGEPAMNSVAVSVVQTDDQIPVHSPDLIVFPERVSWDELHAARSRCPKAAIVGGALERGRIHATLLHAGNNQIDYWKIGDDGITKGSGDFRQASPVYEFDDMCVRVVICMDTDIRGGAFCRAVGEKIRSSERHWKFLCVPAAMAGHWFHGTNIGSSFAGMHVVLCNNVKAWDLRCASFVTDTVGNKIRIQENDEPIHVSLAE